MSRVLLLLLAAAALAVALVRGSDDRACRDAQQQAFAIGVRSAPAAGARRVAQRVEADCRGGAALAAASTGLLKGGAIDAAAELARAATARDPEDYRGWRASAVALAARGDAAAAASAEARVDALLPPRPAPD